MNSSETQPRIPRHSRLFRIIQALERTAAVSYVLDSQHRLLHCNPAWNNFAISNGAPQLVGEQVIGSNVFDVLPEVFKKFYMDAFARALTGGIWEISYECSSPSLFRRYRMRVHGLKSRALWMVTNSLIYEGPHRKTVKADSSKYFQPTGLIIMCAHCRCSQRVDAPDQWDFVPDHLGLKGQASLKVSHGFCPICYAYFH